MAAQAFAIIREAARRTLGRRRMGREAKSPARSAALARAGHSLPGIAAPLHVEPEVGLLPNTRANMSAIAAVTSKAKFLDKKLRCQFPGRALLDDQTIEMCLAGTRDNWLTW